jgi:hypothetical protein
LLGICKGLARSNFEVMQRSNFYDNMQIRGLHDEFSNTSDTKIVCHSILIVGIKLKLFFDAENKFLVFLEIKFNIILIK